MNPKGSALLSIGVLLSALSMTSPAAGAESPKTSLTFLTWASYIDPEIVSSFEEQHNATVRLVNFETDDGRDELLLQTGGKGFDLILANGAAVAKYRLAGWLAPLSQKDIPNLRHIDQSYMNYFADVDEYAAPYFWGTLGIAYRMDLYDKPVRSWRALFQPAPELAGHIAMIRSSRDVIGMALKTLGYSMNSENLTEIAAVEPMLRALRSKVKDYSYIVLDETSALVTGEIKMAMVYSGDALILKSLNPQIAYVAPEEGSGKWIDYIVVSAASRQKALAHEFINYMNEPVRAAANATYVRYATPNAAAEALLPAEILNDPVIYPPAEILDKTEVFRKLSPRALRARNQLFANVSE